MKGVIGFCLGILISASAWGKVEPGTDLAAPRLRGEEMTGKGWFRLAIEAPTNQVYTLQSSGNLTDWRTVAVLHGPEFETMDELPFLDPASAGATPLFYRAVAEPITFDTDWKNQITFPWDSFRSEPTGFGMPETRWVKFAILTNEPARVYYQNSWKYKFHYDFAVARLPGFKGMSATEFDAITLRTNQQQAVLGAVLFAPREDQREIGIQFVGQDLYPAEQVAEWFDIVRASIVPLEDLRTIYMPTYEQARLSPGDREMLEGRGIEVGSLSEWDTGENAYSTGWALGGQFA